MFVQYTSGDHFLFRYRVFESGVMVLQLHSHREEEVVKQTAEQVKQRFIIGTISDFVNFSARNCIFVYRGQCNHGPTLMPGWFHKQSHVVSFKWHFCFSIKDFVTATDVWRLYHPGIDIGAWVHCIDWNLKLSSAKAQTILELFDSYMFIKINNFWHGKSMKIVHCVLLVVY